MRCLISLQAAMLKEFSRLHGRRQRDNRGSDYYHLKSSNTRLLVQQRQVKKHKRATNGQVSDVRLQLRFILLRVMI